jgi:hypothetical protein
MAANCINCMMTISHRSAMAQQRPAPAKSMHYWKGFRSHVGAKYVAARGRGAPVTPTGITAITPARGRGRQWRQYHPYRN